MNAIDTPLSPSVVFRSAKVRSFAERKTTLRRRGFTLIELLVVISIMGILAAIMIFAYSPFQTRSSANYGGVLLQSWLNAAKQRALRDRRPCGLRFLPGDAGTNANLVTRCIYIEQAEDIVGTGAYTGAGETTLHVPGANETAEMVSVEVNGGLVHQGNLASQVITLKTPFPYKIPQPSTATYRIIRSPRAITDPNTAAAGASKDINSAATEDFLRIPVGAAINLDAYSTAIPSITSFYSGLSPGAPPLDIMFNPDGSVQTPAINNDKIILWVTNIQTNASGAVDPRQGQPSLIVVYTKTGAIAGYPAHLDWNGTAWNNADPYKNVP